MPYQQSFDLRSTLNRAGTAPRPTLAELEDVCRRPAVVADPPAPTDIRRDNPRKQGEIGFSDAIGWFGRRGLTVSVPLGDAQAYDLIVDLDGKLARVQVKTSTVFSPMAFPWRRSRRLAATRASTRASRSTGRRPSSSTSSRTDGDG